MRSENQANQLVTNRLIKLQMALTDIEFYQLVLHSKLQAFLAICYSALPNKTKAGHVVIQCRTTNKNITVEKNKDIFNTAKALRIKSCQCNF